MNGGVPECNDARFFRTDGVIEYVPFADDFGPMSLSSIIFFIELMEYELTACAESGLSALVFLPDDGRRNFTNAAFLLGVYMIIRLDESAIDVAERFDVFESAMFEGYRDASSDRPDFRLSLLDCWQGLERAKALDWVALPIPGSSAWGMIEPNELRHYESRLNADLHEVVPGKLICMAGPRDLGGRSFLDSRKRGTRAFSPEYYVDILRALGVTTVVRLNEPRYDRRAFAAAGFDHVDLFVEVRSRRRRGRDGRMHGWMERGMDRRDLTPSSLPKIDRLTGGRNLFHAGAARFGNGVRSSPMRTVIIW